MLDSSFIEKPWPERLIRRLIKKCSNNSILDIGAGSGKNLDSLKPKLQRTEFTALEDREEYLSSSTLESKYNYVIKEDIRKFKPSKIYGITIYSDIETLPKEEADENYNKLLQNSEFIVIITPAANYETTAPFENISLLYVESGTGIYVGYNPKLHKKEEIFEAEKTRYAVYGIYNNEENFIERFLESVKDADQIVLCDTGSKDKTNVIINEFIEKNPNVNLNTYKIHVSPWRFDDARNAALSLVNEDIDICISLDIDEYLMDNWRMVLDSRFNLNFTRYYHKFKTFWSGGGYSAHWHDRIHIRSGYAWKLPVHEILEYKTDEVICWMEEFWIYHKPDDQKSRTSYLPMLEQSVKERPDVWKTWCFLAGEYMAAGRYDEALKNYDKAFEISSSDKGYLYKMRYYIYKAQNNPELALLNINNAIGYMTGRREPVYEKAHYLHELGRNLEAYFTLKDAERITNKQIDYHFSANAWDEEFDNFMATLTELAKKEGLNI